MFLVIGSPVWIIGAIIDKARKKQIIEDVVNEEMGQQRYSQPEAIDNSCSSSKSFDLDSKKVALKKGETVEDWSNRIASYAETADPEIAGNIIDMAKSIMNMSKHIKPKAGETIKAYLSRSSESIEYLQNSDQSFDSDLASSGIRKDEAFDNWIVRVAFHIEADTGETQEALRDLAKYVKPKIGEPLQDYMKRAQARISSIDTSINLNSEESSIQPGESPKQWLDRVAPLFLKVDDGDSFEEVIEAMVDVAKKASPMKGETARAWLNRIEPLIDEANED